MNDEIIIEEDTNQDEILLDNDTVIYKQEKDYDKLDNKPSINNVELQGNKTLHDLGIQPEGNYVEQEQGKGLSTNDFTTTEKNKLANLENYDDTEIKADITDLQTNKANKSETYTKTETDALLQDKADTEDIPDVSDFITKDVDNLTNYTKSSDMTSAINTAVGNETTARENSDVRLQNQIDAITSASDVVDVVGTYADLQNYDTTKLTDKDLIKVMQDSTHNNALSYFRWLNNAWSYVGSEGPFYTKSENDTLLNEKQNEINSNNKLASDLVDDTNSGNKFTNTTEKQTWNNKYDKPSGGIPKTDLASAVQTSLGKADTALQTHQDISGKEDKSNKVTEINETNTDTQYPSAKAVHNKMANLGTTKTTSGTSIDITDSAEGNMPLGIKGNTSQQTYTGKNLFTFKNIGNTNRYGIQSTMNNSEIILNGTTDASGQLVSRQSSGITLPAGTYIVTFSKISGGVTSNGNIAMFYFRKPNGATLLEYSLEIGSSFSQRLALTEDTEIYIEIYCNGANYVINNLKFAVQIEEGSTATPYEPYVGGTTSPNPEYPQEVKTVTGDNAVKVRNKNYIEPYENSNTITFSNGSISFEDNIYHLVVNYDTTGQYYRAMSLAKYAVGTNYGDYIAMANPNVWFKIPKGTYTLCFHYISGSVSSNSGDIYIYKSQTGLPDTLRALSVASFKLKAEDTSVTFTLEEDTYIYIAHYFWSSNPNCDIYFQLQLVKKENADYQVIPYEGTDFPLSLGELELCEKGDYQDYPHKENGKWYKHKEIQKIKLSSLSWRLETFGYTATIDTSNIIIPATTNSLASLLCDVYTACTPNNAYGLTGNIEHGISIYTNQFLVRETTIRDLNDFNTMVENANVYVINKTPIEEEITDTTLIAQLEAIYNNAKSYEGETHIFTITENESPYIEAEYSIDNVENTLNKATSIDENSTNKEYPSAKAVYDYGQSIADKGEVYSTEEQVIGTWFGKPLYRKVIECGVLPNTAGNIQIESGLQYDTTNYIKIYGFIRSTFATMMIPIYNNAIPEQSITLYASNSGKIFLATNTDRSAYTGTIVLEYTKTTD